MSSVRQVQQNRSWGKQPAIEADSVGGLFSYPALAAAYFAGWGIYSFAWLRRLLDDLQARAVARFALDFDFVWQGVSLPKESATKPIAAARLSTSRLAF